jgi:GT2 family glycosyltransferase
MSVSVIIVNWNSGKLLEKCIGHLKRQTVLPQYVYVIDNANTDGSLDNINPSDWLRIIKSPKNIGFAAGNNRALLECDTDFVALLNPDAFPEPDWIEKLMTAAEKNPDAVAFGSRQLCYEDKTILDGIGDCYHVSGLVWRKRHGLHQRSRDMEEQEIFSPCAAAAMYRRNAIEAVGGFDEDYFCYLEDVDLGFRLRLAGYKAIYVPGAVVRHVGSATTGGQRSNFSVYHGHRNLVWTYVKNMPGPLFWLFLPFQLWLNLITIIFFIVRGQFNVIMQAKWDAIIGLPCTLAKRRKIQKGLKASIVDIWQALDRHLVPNKRILFFRLKRSIRKMRSI